MKKRFYLLLIVLLIFLSNNLFAGRANNSKSLFIKIEKAYKELKKQTEELDDILSDARIEGSFLTKNFFNEPFRFLMDFKKGTISNDFKSLYHEELKKRVKKIANFYLLPSNRFGFGEQGVYVSFMIPNYYDLEHIVTPTVLSKWATKYSSDFREEVEKLIELETKYLSDFKLKYPVLYSELILHFKETAFEINPVPGAKGKNILYTSIQYFNDLLKENVIKGKANKRETVRYKENRTDKKVIFNVYEDKTFNRYKGEILFNSEENIGFYREPILDAISDLNEVEKRNHNTIKEIKSLKDKYIKLLEEEYQIKKMNKEVNNVKSTEVF